MAFRMSMDDALALRLGLEPLTKAMVATAGDVMHEDAILPLTSIAISLKRIADVMEKLDAT